MSEILVIGYGNTLRGDDAAGVRAAELLRDRVDDVDVVLVTDLSLELAAPISHHDHVVFIDASAEGDSVRLRSIDAKTPPPALSTHTSSPWTLVEACRRIYGRTPRRTILATIPGETFDLGETLSNRTGQLVEECVSTLQAEILKLRERSAGETNGSS
jgi:hydrogenase maturation protease